MYNILVTKKWGVKKEERRKRELNTRCAPGTPASRLSSRLYGKCLRADTF